MKEHTKLILLLLFLVLLLVPTVYAFEFDNVGSYDEENQRMIISNAFNLPFFGNTLAELKLTTPLNFKVPRGYNKIAEIEITNFKRDYFDALRGMDFYDIKHSYNRINRRFDYKYQTYVFIDKPTYTQVCNIKVDRRDWISVRDNCNQVQNGTKKLRVEKWVKFTQLEDLPQESKITIGIFTIVEKGDVIEWIPTFFGVKINEWATWTEGLNVGLVSYKKLESSIGNVAIDEVLAYNGNNSGANVVAGKILNGYDFEQADNDFLDIGQVESIFNQANDFSFSGWVKMEDNSTYSYVFGSYAGSEQFTFYLDKGQGNRMSVVILGVDSAFTSLLPVVGQWEHLVLIHHSSDDIYQFCLNNVCENVSWASSINSDNQYRLGKGSNAENFDGIIDEVGFWDRTLTDSEIDDLYNSGVGLTYTDAFNVAPNVSIHLPPDGTTVSSNGYSADFICSSVSANTIDNVTLRVFNLSSGLEIYSQVNTSIVNNTNITFTQVLIPNNYTWNCYAIDNSSLEGYAVSNFSINISAISNNAPNIEYGTGNPTGKYTTSGATYNFNFTNVSDDINLNNVSLYINSNLNQTNSSGVNNTDYLFDLVLSDGDYNYYGVATDNESQSTQTATQNFSIDSTRPLINITSPVSNYVRLIGGQAIDLNYSVTETNKNTCIYNYPFEISPNRSFPVQWFDGANETTKSINGDSYNFTVNSDQTTLEFITFAPSTNATAINSQDLTLCTAVSGEYHVRLNITNDPNDGDQKYRFFCGSTPLSTVSTINATFGTERFPAQLRTTNQQNYTLNCTGTTTTFNYVVDSNSITLLANDTFGNVNFTSQSWTIDLIENSQTYPATTTEGATETFSANVTLGTDIIVQSVAFIYDGTEYIGEVFASGNNYITRMKDFIIPDVTNITNVTFYFNLTLSSGGFAVLTSYNTTVNPISLDDCSVYTNQIFSFTNVKEKEQTPITNSTIEYAVNIFTQDGAINLLNVSAETTNNPLNICLGFNLTNTSTYLVDTIIKYSGFVGNITYVVEYYNINNFELQNGTALQNITLYDLDTTNSTDFKVTYTGADFVPVENALIYVNRQYISENVFKTVELPKTDNNGQTIIHLVRNSQIYNFVVVVNGEIAGTFNNIVAFCDDFSIGDCQIQLNGQETGEEIYDANEELGIIYSSPTYDNVTRFVTFNFVTDDGTVKTVSMNVTRNDVFGNRSVCTSVVESSGGTLTCQVPDTIDDTFLKTTVYVDGLETVSDTVTLTELGMGTFGYFILFIYVISLSLMFARSKSLLVVGLILGIFSGIALGLIEGKGIGTGAIGISLLVAGVLLLWKLNKEKQQ